MWDSSAEHGIGGFARKLAAVFAPAAYASEAEPTGAVDASSPAVVKEFDASPSAGDLIARLKSESLEESMRNLDLAGDYYSGYTNPGGPAAPFDQIRMILSNRRFAKVYSGLRELGADAARDGSRASRDGDAVSGPGKCAGRRGWTGASVRTR